MKYFTVTFKKEITFSVLVRAEDREDAVDLASSLDADSLEFTDGIKTDESDFSVDVVEEASSCRLRDSDVVVHDAIDEEDDYYVTTLGELRAAEAKREV
ncbi:MAG: hypothetical protein IV100_12475 [Myxococcales bacterium]|uniref:hypothetical protein n=1 Tax=Sediminibacterium sp. TaxID=1917865 RepID=UPI001D9A3D9C|nr:hypothetical protein [Sediminibacterium sp.]MBT9485821.1 hypothetical protein [Sediminibacterium sp.]MBT9556841.1 hypothetical protein [Myxococcales bacterium]